MDFYNSLPYVHRVLQIFGVSQITIDRQNANIDLNKRWKAYQIIAWIVMGYLVFVEMVAFALNGMLPMNYMVVIFLQFATYYIAVLSICFESLRVHYERHSLLFRKLEQISKKQNRLAPFSTEAFQAIRRRIIVYSLLYVAVYLFNFGFGMYTTFISPPVTTLNGLLYNLMFLVLGAKCYQILLLVYLVKVHMDRLNQSLLSMWNPFRRRKANLCENFENLKLAQEIYDDIYDLTQMICSTFGTFFLINVPVDMFNLTVNLCWVIFSIKFIGGWHIVQCILAMLPNVWKFSNLAVMCQLAVNSGSKVGSYISKVLIDSSQMEHVVLVEMLSLQVIHKPIAFSIYNLVDFNATIFFNLFGVFATYLVFLLQATNVV